MVSGHVLHDGHELSYIVQGPDTGIPIIMIHGWTCDMTDWSFQVPFLLQKYTCLRVILMDLRYHGSSRSPRSSSSSRNSTPATSPGLSSSGSTSSDQSENEEDYLGRAPKMSVTHLASDAAAVLQHLGVDETSKAIIMGHSLGGAVAAQLAHDHPSVARALVLLDPAYLVPAEVLVGIRDALRPDFVGTVQAVFENNYAPLVTPEYLKTWHALRAAGMDAEAGTAAMDEFAGMMMREGEGVEGGAGEGGKVVLRGGAGFVRRTRTKIPRLVVGWLPELVFGVEREAGLDEKLDRIEVLDAGHWMMKVDPEGFNSLLGSWLEEQGFC